MKNINNKKSKKGLFLRGLHMLSCEYFVPPTSQSNRCVIISFFIKMPLVSIEDFQI